MSFEQLKREATALERQLEDKLSRYQQVSTAVLRRLTDTAPNCPIARSALCPSHSIELSLPMHKNVFIILSQLAQKLNQQSVTPGRDSLSRAEEGGDSMLLDDEMALQSELDRLISRLQDLISGRLSAAASTSSQQAAVKRFREILLDLRTDYDKSVMNVRRAKERRELLSGGGRGGNQTGGNDNDGSMEHLLRERSHIQNSMNMANDVIGQADAVRSDLFGQGRALRSASNLMAKLTGNIPGLNHLVEQIRRKRSRDDKIVAGVIATCIVFTFWYVLG